MNNTSVTKYSALGLLLAIASAIISGVFPSQNNASTDLVGTLIFSTDFSPEMTCVFTNVPDLGCILSFTTDTSTNLFMDSSTDNLGSDVMVSTSREANTTE